MGRRIIVFTFLLILPVVALAQEIEFSWSYVDAKVYDARARALGHNEVMAPSGSNAMFSNPAHMALLERNTLQVGGRAWMGSGEYEYWDLYEDRDYSLNMKLNPWYSHASFAIPYETNDDNLDITFGVGFFTLYDLSINNEFEMDRTDIDYTTTTTNKGNGGLNLLTPSVAVGIQDRFYIGAALNRSIMSKAKLETEVTVENEGDEFNATEEIDFTLGASFLTLGGMFVINEQVSVGFMYRTGYDMSGEDIEYNYSDSDGYEGSTPIPDVEITVPSTMGLGVAFQLSPSVLLVGEYQGRPWSDYELEGEDSGIDDGANYRLGLELQGAVPLRFGYFMDSIAATDIGDDKPKSYSGFTAGIGLGGESFMIDIVGEYGFWGFEYDDYDLDGNEQTFEYKETIIALGITLIFGL